MIVLAFGVPKMGKTQFLMDLVSTQALEQRFFVVCRAGDWLPEHGRYRCEFDSWEVGSTPADEPAIVTELKRAMPNSLPVLRDALVSLGLVSDNGRPWYAEAPPPDSDMLEGWLAGLPPTGVFRFGYPWEGLDVADVVRELGDTTYVDDEIDEVAVFAGWPKNPIRAFCHRGRHLPNANGEVGKVHILGAARRAQSLHVDVSNLADEVAIFRVQGHRTFERLIDDRMVEPEEVDSVRMLEPYHYKLWKTSGESSWKKLAPLGEHVTV